jgi:hypothetical protein
MKFQKPATAVLVALSIWTIGSPVAGQGLALEIVNRGSAAVAGEPVSIGVPFPLTSPPLLSISQPGLSVSDALGQTVPAQFKVLSRWHGQRDDAGAPLKWVLVSFAADVPGQSTATYVLRSGANLPGQLMAYDTPGALYVFTDPSSLFVLDKVSFRLFKEVQIDGWDIVALPGGRMDMRDLNGNSLPCTVSETVVEENGSVRFVVRQRGTVGGLHWTCRWYFHSERRDVTVDFRLENHGAYGLFSGMPSSHRYFDSLHLDLPISQAGASVTTPDGQRWLTGGDYDLRQDFAWGANTLDVLSGFQFSEQTGQQVLNSGTRFEGALDLSGPGGGVTVAVDRFWENFPKALEVENGTLRLGLWPAWGHGPEFRGQYGNISGPASAIDPLALQYYRFEGGRWKTHRMTFDFHAGGRNPAAAGAVAQRLRLPLAGRPEPRWTKLTHAVGHLFSERRAWSRPADIRYERMGDVMHDDSQATSQAGLGQIGLRAFRKRGGTYGGKQFYGWENYGDIIWAEGASSLHYDWTLSMLLRWYRGGDYGFFDVGRDMAWHKRDYDQNHSTDPAEYWRGASFYEKGWWHGNFLPGGHSHTWLGGILLHYAMTGDESSYEAALEAQGYFFRNPPSSWGGSGGSRSVGWAVDNLVDLHNYLGHPQAIVEAQAGIATFQNLEAQYGSNGYVLNPYTLTGPYPMRCQPWMHNIVFNAVARYTLFTGDTQFTGLMQRMLNWFKTECLEANGGAPGSFQLPLVYG